MRSEITAGVCLIWSSSHRRRSSCEHMWECEFVFGVEMKAQRTEDWHRWWHCCAHHRRRHHRLPRPPTVDSVSQSVSFFIIHFSHCRLDAANRDQASAECADEGRSEPADGRTDGRTDAWLFHTPICISPSAFLIIFYLSVKFPWVIK